MQIITATKFNIQEIEKLLRQKSDFGYEKKSAVRKIIIQVKLKGDKALYNYAKRFDGADLKSLKVTRKEIENAYRQTPPDLLMALKTAARNIRKFHKSQSSFPKRKTRTEEGVNLWAEFRPIDSVGLYVPGGRSPYPSTVLMLGLPAKIAGCKNIVLCTPPNAEGIISPAILAAAKLVGIDQIYKVGGAGAIAAMAYGTETIPRVLKIFGPGNQFVTLAKLMLFGEVDIDMPAGPSEIMILADETANPRWVAADALSQLEHGEDSQVILVTCSRWLAGSVEKEIRKQIPKLKRKAIIKKSLRRSFVILAESLRVAYSVVNAYAPEHLEIILRKKKAALKSIKNAGSIFLGSYASEPLGDYATGANHTLPTAGYAKTFSALSALSFGKTVQVQDVSKKGIANLRKTVETLALAENLDAHKNSVSIRFD